MTAEDMIKEIKMKNERRDLCEKHGLNEHLAYQLAKRFVQGIEPKQVASKEALHVTTIERYYNKFLTLTESEFKIIQGGAYPKGLELP